MLRLGGLLIGGVKAEEDSKEMEAKAGGKTLLISLGARFLEDGEE